MTPGLFIEGDSLLLLGTFWLLHSGLWLSWKNWRKRIITAPKGTASLKLLNTSFLKIVLSTAKQFFSLWVRHKGFLSENLRKKQRWIAIEDVWTFRNSLIEWRWGVVKIQAEKKDTGLNLCVSLICDQSKGESCQNREGWNCPVSRQKNRKKTWGGWRKVVFRAFSKRSYSCRTQPHKGLCAKAALSDQYRSQL